MYKDKETGEEQPIEGTFNINIPVSADADTDCNPDIFEQKMEQNFNAISRISSELAEETDPRMKKTVEDFEKTRNKKVDRFSWDSNPEIETEKNKSKPVAGRTKRDWTKDGYIEDQVFINSFGLSAQGDKSATEVKIDTMLHEMQHTHQDAMYNEEKKGGKLKEEDDQDKDGVLRQFDDDDRNRDIGGEKDAEGFAILFSEDVVQKLPK